jgi:hypothetical protein
MLSVKALVGQKNYARLRESLTSRLIDLDEICRRAKRVYNVITILACLAGTRLTGSYLGDGDGG